MPNQHDTNQLERSRHNEAVRILEAATTAHLIARAEWLQAYLEDADSGRTAAKRRHMLHLEDERDRAETRAGLALEALRAAQLETRRNRHRRNTATYRQRLQAAGRGR